MDKITKIYRFMRPDEEPILVLKALTMASVRVNATKYKGASV
jgi:hypothetical protein